MIKQNDFSIKTVKEVFDILKTSDKGLSHQEAERRRSEYGENRLSISSRTPNWLKFLLQFKDVLVIILIVAGILSFIIGNFRDGFIMFIIVLINAATGYFQGYKAERIMDSLKKLVQSPAKVYRDNELAELPQAHIVPGDIIYLEEGDKVPADSRIIESFNLRT
ncbi:MAG: cation-transporting P-type ATPase, partial [bacterium]